VLMMACAVLALAGSIWLKAYGGNVIRNH
jgi:hypothetical protein